MKVQRDREGVGFHTFDVTFTIESEEEARALYAIFNYVPNIALLPNGTGEIVRKVMGEKFRELGPDQLIARGVTYSKFYPGKKENL